MDDIKKETGTPEIQEETETEEAKLNIENIESYEAKPSEGMILLQDHILDKKVLDLEGNEVEMVYDIKLVLRNNKLYVSDVDASRYGLLRRVGLKGLANFIYSLASKIKTDTIPWMYIEHLPEPVSMITIDASFISLKVLLPVVKRWLTSPINPPESSKGTVIALIKPQFEAGRAEVGRGKGVIRDPAIHRQVLLDVLNYAQLQGFVAKGLIRSPISGPKGNIEFLTWLESDGEHPAVLEALVDVVLPGVS